MSDEFERVLSGAKRARGKGDLHQARLLFEKYLRVYPNHSPASLDLAETYMALELFAEASRVYARLLENEPKQPVVLSNLGGALLRQGLLDEAKAVLDYALELDPKNIYARINLGGVLQGKELHKEALENALEAVTIDPSHSLTFNNLGSALSDLSMYHEARHAFETAAMLDPEGIDALLNLADMESRLGDPAAASKIYDKVLSMLAPHENGRKELVKFYASMVYKQLGRLQDYWDGYECGFNPFIPKGAARSPNRLFKVPKWDGSKVSNKKLLVWREQGVGDELLYSSILPELESLGMEVIFECEARLVSVWKRSFPGFVVREARFDGVSMYPLIQDFDLHLPICSLGSLFRRSVESFERFRPFIIPREDLLLEYKQKLDAVSRGRPKVGVLWRSIKLNPKRVRAYTNPVNWSGILDREDLCFVNLQYNLHESEKDSVKANFGSALHIFDEIDLKDDFERTIALVANLDLVISPDTTMFEIAGSLGIQTLLMTVHSEGYFGKTDNFIFYPSVELIRAPSFSPNSGLEALELTKSRLRDIYGEGKA